MGLLDFLQGDEKFVSAQLLLIERDLQSEWSFDRATAVGVVMEDARSRLQKHKSQIADSIGAGRIQPDQVAWRMIYDAAHGALLTGKFHFGRGSLCGEGKELRRIVSRSLQELKKLGLGTDEDIKGVEEELDHWISDIG
jgi:hypothetical protein